MSAPMCLPPQCTAEQSGWRDISDQVFALIDVICESYPIDPERVILTGHSMGGTGTWALATIAPERFSCIVSMSGSIWNTRENRQALAHLPVWAFVAEQDKMVEPASSTGFITQLTKVNPQARLLVFEDAGHRDVPALAWLDVELELLDWMLSQ